MEAIQEHVPWQLRPVRPEILRNLCRVSGWPPEEVKERLVEPGEPVGAPVQALGGRELIVRPGTSDVLVLIDTFVNEYNVVPPMAEPEVILDLGANIGTTMVQYAYLYEKARIVGVELDAENHALCERNIASWRDRCDVLHAAIAATDGVGHYDKGIRGAEWGWGFRLGDGDASVQTVSIDSLLDRYGLERVDWLKMDIEGAEQGVLQAAGNWPERVRSMRVETHEHLGYKYSPDAAIEDLTKLGFSCRTDEQHFGAVFAERQ